MVYLEHSKTRFWRCEVTTVNNNNNTVITTTYGRCGSNGRKLKKHFDTKADANDFIQTQADSKRKDGYVDVDTTTDPTDDMAVDTSPAKPSRRSERKKKVVTPPSDTTLRVGSNKHSSPDRTDPDREEDVVVVDSGVSKIDSALASRVKVHDDFHAKLALVDPSKNVDQYYILQILIDNKTKKQRSSSRSSVARNYYLYMRWGRTGTEGQTKLDGPLDLKNTEKKFCTMFKSKTGVEWMDAEPGAAPPQSGKYELIKTIDASDEGTWYYYLTSDPLGKLDGWYAHEEDDSNRIEELYQEFVASGRAKRFSIRLIHSESSSGFTYKMNLDDMTQANTQTAKVRPIIRSTDGTTPCGVPTPPDPSTTTASPAKANGVSSTTSTPPPPPPVISATTPKTKSAVSTTAQSSSSPSSAVAGTVDSFASSSLRSGSVYGEYDVMLNQTNLAANNNKFYKIQLVQTSDGVYLFTRWGRVGEDGAFQEVGAMDSEEAIKEFAKKFKSKTGNKWEDRDDFQPKKGKYTIVEMEKDSDAAEAMSTRAEAVSSSLQNAAAAAAAAPPSNKLLPCTLDDSTKRLVDLIFNEDMFKTAMKAMDLDPAKLPLGALSSTQIEKGFAALEDIEEELDSGAANPNKLMELTSKFYTIIPHAFGRRRGPVLNTQEMVNDKYDMLNTLTDIEAAQSMQKRIKQQESTSSSSSAAQAHPSDLNYQQLATDLTRLSQNDKDRKIIETYFNNTNQNGRMKLCDIWKVNRHDESKRFAAHADISNRRLLWHGTSVAVVAAIMKSGLRIMPHSGGRVGRGIYLADQHAKSAMYVGSARGKVIMFLVEAALGKQHEITRDDPSLTAAPPGFGSVLAKGRMAPSQELDVETNIDGNAVKVPQGVPVSVESAKDSSFYQNEFLIYKESQHRIRYILTFDV